MSGIVCSIALVFAACQPVATPVSDPDAAVASIIGPEWILNELQGEQQIHEGIVTANFDTAGTLTGSAGCNDYETAYETNSGDLLIDPNIHSAEMDCGEAIMVVESAYLASLQRAASYEIEEEVMFIRDSDGTVLLVFNANGT